MKCRVRMVEFVGETEYPQGSGLTWDDVVIDIPDDEQIVEVQALSLPIGRTFNGHLAVVRVWLMTEVDE